MLALRARTHLQARFPRAVLHKEDAGGWNSAPLWLTERGTPSAELPGCGSGVRWRSPVRWERWCFPSQLGNDCSSWSGWDGEPAPSAGSFHLVSAALLLLSMEPERSFLLRSLFQGANDQTLDRWWFYRYIFSND